MPAAQVEFDDGDEALGGVIDLGNGQQHLGMAHEACKRGSAGGRHHDGGGGATSHELGNPLQHASRLENEGRQDNAAQVGAWPQLGNDVHKDYTRLLSTATLDAQARGLGREGTYRCPGRAQRRGCHPRLRHRTRSGYLRAGAVSVLFERLVSPGLRAGSGKKARTSR